MKKANKEEKIKKYRALNTHIILWFFLFASLSVLGALSFIAKEKTLAVGLLIFAAISISPLLFSPIYYIFTKKDVTIVYLFGIKEKIEWWETKSVTEEGSYFGGNGLPHYHISYPKRKKRPFFVTGEITKTRRTKKLLKKLYIKEIK